MAESETSDKSDVKRLECAVCLLTCIHPVQLPCGHIFCFLCMKGVANQNKRCAMCRKEVPSDYLEHPILVKTAETEPPKTTSQDHEDDGYRWFYEGHNGWWQYDERTSQELQIGFNKGEKTFELLIAGFLYVIDFDNMVQFRRSDPSRRRRFKRDLATIPKKGIAGLRSSAPVGSSSSSPDTEPLPNTSDFTSPPLATDAVAEIPSSVQPSRTDSLLNIIIGEMSDVNLNDGPESADGLLGDTPPPNDQSPDSSFVQYI